MLKYMKINMVVTAIPKTQDGQLITGDGFEINTKFYKIVVVDGIGKKH